MKKKTAKETEQKMVKGIYDFFDGPQTMRVMEVQLKNHYSEIMQLLIRIGQRIIDDETFKKEEELLGKILLKTAVANEFLYFFFAPFKAYSIIAGKKKLRTKP